MLEDFQENSKNPNSWQVRNLTRNKKNYKKTEKSKLITKSTPTDSRNRFKIDGTLF